MINFLLALTLQYTVCDEIYEDLAGKKGTEENILVCTLLIEDAKNLDIDIGLTLSTAWEESRFTEQFKPTRYNCIGPLQIKYKYWCPNSKGKVSIIKKDGKLNMCDPFYHGVKTLKYYVNKFKPLEKALCFYNNSKKCKKTYKSNYVKRVLGFKTKINTVLKKKVYSTL